MDYAATPGPASGRVARLYFNVNTTGPVVKLRQDSPVGTFTFMTELALIDKDNYTPGKINFVEGEVRARYQKIRLEGSAELGSIKFSYTRHKGTTDLVWTALNSFSQPGDVPVEFLVADDDITLEGTTYDRLFCIVSRVGEDRDLGKVVSTDFECTEVTHYETVVATETLMLTVSETTPAP